MSVTALVLIAAPIVVAGYAYAGYPLLLLLLGGRRTPPTEPRSDPLPTISITVAVYNEEASIGQTLEQLLATDYPRERRQIIVISDASTDGTDEVVGSFSDRGVELIRLPQRGGKTAAENASSSCIRGDVVVNVDATIRIDPHALKPLIAAFTDPTVGVASGRDVSVGSGGHSETVGESAYVGYEMWVRELETRLYGIVGASGCFYATRTDLHREVVPKELSRDFAAPLIAREHGLRSVSVRDAVCFVSRTTSLRREYRRKVRTMARGLGTLAYKRHLLNPLRYGWFAWMLSSHKLMRWLVPWAAVAAVVGLALLSVASPGLWWLGPASVIGIASVMIVSWSWPAKGKMPALVAVPGYLLFGIAAGVRAWIKAWSGDLQSVWEPTRR